MPSQASQSSNVPPLPPGYALDSGTPPLPAGYALDSGVPLTSTGIAAPQGIAPSMSAKDIVEGFPLGMANTVGSSVAGVAQLLHKFPYIGEKLSPQAGIDALRSITAERSKPQNTGQAIGRAAEQIGEFLLPTGFEAKAVSVLPKAMQGARFIPSLARVAVVGGETGIRSASQGSDFGTGAAVGAATGVVGEIGRVAAPKLIEKALGVTGWARQFGKTPGQALLENTGALALTPSRIAKQAQKVSLGLTGEMEAGVKAASGTVSTMPARQVLDDAIQQATARNSGLRVAQLNKVKDQLMKEFDTGNPIGQTVTPEKLLRLKQGIGDTVKSWGAEAKGITPVVRQVYRALDNELDAAIPGNDVLNQRISSLIEGSKAANATAIGRKRSGLAAAAHLVGKGILPSIGFGAGYEHGGAGEGLALGSAALVLQTPTAQIAIARLIKSGLPERLARGIVAGGLLNKGGK